MKQTLLITRFMALMLLAMSWCLVGCIKNEDSQENEGEWSGWGKGVEPTTLKQDFSMSDMDNFFELNLKMENLRLQFVKFMSNGWEGQLLEGAGDKSDPTKMYELLEEILDKKDAYGKAIENLTDQGIFDNVTTRGIFTSTYNMIVDGWGSTAKTRRMKILDMLEENKVMGNAEAQRQLFNVLPVDLRKGETDPKKWFAKLNQGEYDNACPQIHARWVNMGAGESGNVTSAVGQYYVAAEKAANGKNPLHIDAYKVGVEQAQKAADFNAAVWDVATGSYLGKWQDADVIMGETSKLREKIHDGSATIDDFNKWVVGVGSVYAKDRIGDLLGGEINSKDPDWVRIIKENTPEGTSDIAGEMADWLIERANEQADENAAKSNNLTIAEIQNMLDKINNPAGYVINDEKGRITVTGADKDGNGHLVMRPGDKTLTTVTRDGKRTTQKVDAKPGKTTIEAIPGMEGEYEWYIDVSPKQMVFDYQIDTDVFVVTTYAKYFSAMSKNDWIHVSTNGTNVIVKVDQNDTGEGRDGTVLIGLSQDQKTFPRTATLTVYQRAEPEAQDLASFIDLNNLRIDNIKLGTGWSEKGTGDKVSISIKPGGLTSNVDWPFEDLNTTSFAASELTTRRISDNVYEVSGSKFVPIDQDSWTDEDGLLAPDSPYGAYYDISFNLEAREPSALIEENNFAVTNFMAKGYYKWRDTNGHADLLYRFTLEAGAAGIDHETYTKRSCKMDASYASLNNDATFLRWDVSEKYFLSWPVGDENGNINYTHSPKGGSNKGTINNSIFFDFEMTLAW